MKTLLIALLFLLLPFNCLYGLANTEPDITTFKNEAEKQKKPVYYRRFQATLPMSYSPEVSATLGILGNQIFQDINHRFIEPAVPGVFGNILSEIWSVFWTYEFTLWPHEFGHWTRAAQVNSQFIFHNVNPFLPYTTVEMGKNATLKDEALLSIGGFEVNSLIARNSQRELYKNNYAFSDQLTHGWVNKSFFPIYAFLVVPQNPELPETWTKTAGDPVHFVLPTYKMFSGKEPVTADNKVQKDLINYYNESIYLSLAWEMLDPIFYQTLINDFSGKKSANEPVKPLMLLGDADNGWTYGTLFNPSPLGYELYLFNYFKINSKLYSLYLKYGRPFQNLGIGIDFPDIIKNDNFSTGVNVDVWQQDSYNLGLSLRADLEWFFNDNWGVFLNGGWKSDGYLLGQPLNSGGFVYTGLSYRYQVK